MKSKHIAALILLSGIAVGCAELQKFQANPQTQFAEKEAGKILLSVGLSAAVNFATGGTFDTAWAIPLALNSVSTAVKDTTSNQQAAALIDATVTSFASDPKLAHVGKDLANAFIAANPQTPAEKQAVVVALSTGASNGLTAASVNP